MGRVGLTLMLAVVLVTTVSCIGIQDANEPSAGAPTLGRELIDLKKAQDADAITYEEYQKLKAKLISNYD